jgi:hypothetical protein
MDINADYKYPISSACTVVLATNSHASNIVQYDVLGPHEPILSGYYTIPT